MVEGKTYMSAKQTNFYKLLNIKLTKMIYPKIHQKQTCRSFCSASIYDLWRLQRTTGMEFHLSSWFMAKKFSATIMEGGDLKLASKFKLEQTKVIGTLHSKHIFGLEKISY